MYFVQVARANRVRCVLSNAFLQRTFNDPIGKPARALVIYRGPFPEYSCGIELYVRHQRFDFLAFFFAVVLKRFSSGLFLVFFADVFTVFFADFFDGFLAGFLGAVFFFGWGFRFGITRKFGIKGSAINGVSAGTMTTCSPGFWGSGSNACFAASVTEAALSFTASMVFSTSDFSSFSSFTAKLPRLIPEANRFGEGAKYKRPRNSRSEAFEDVTEGVLALYLGRGLARAEAVRAVMNVTRVNHLTGRRLATQRVITRVDLYTGVSHPSWAVGHDYQFKIGGLNHQYAVGAYPIAVSLS